MTNLNPRLFFTLGDDGTISYSEFLFLLSLLTKSPTSFEIPFKLIDVSGEGKISAEEFASFCAMAYKSRKWPTEEALQPHNETTLVKLFFGTRNHQSALDFEKFSAFLTSFQREVLLFEFKEFSRGGEFVTAQDFATMLLKFTRLTPEETAEMMQNLPDNVISFEEYQVFINFLNNFEDFGVAVKLFYFAGKPNLGIQEIKKAASVCLSNGTQLSDKIVQILYHLFKKPGMTKKSHLFIVSQLNNNGKY